MTGHLSHLELESYRQRKLSPEALLAADDHLAGCADCRGQLEADAGLADKLKFLQGALRPVHLTEAELDASADGRLQDPIALAHLEGCPQCRGEAADLRSFALQQEVPPRLSKRVPWRTIAAIAALIVFVAGGVLLESKKPTPKPEVQLTRVSPPKELLQDLRVRAIASGRVEIPPVIERMIHHPRGLLRGEAARPALQLESPVATAALTVQPEFRWSAGASALSRVDWYQVAVYDSQFNPVVESEHLAGATWHSSKPLEPGKEYLWQVPASIGGRKTVSPQPPEPEAHFVVLPESESRNLAALSAEYPDDHLLLGVLYARAGAVEQARREWTDPQSRKPLPGAHRLVQSIEMAGQP